MVLDWSFRDILIGIGAGVFTVAIKELIGHESLKIMRKGLLGYSKVL
jgi:hypothetical protein